jgi:hypothetical protein
MMPPEPPPAGVAAEANRELCCAWCDDPDWAQIEQDPPLYGTDIPGDVWTYCEDCDEWTAHPPPDDDA